MTGYESYHPDVDIDFHRIDDRLCDLEYKCEDLKPGDDIPFARKSCLYSIMKQLEFDLDNITDDIIGRFSRECNSMEVERTRFASRCFDTQRSGSHYPDSGYSGSPSSGSCCFEERERDHNTVSYDAWSIFFNKSIYHHITPYGDLYARLATVEYLLTSITPKLRFDEVDARFFKKREDFEIVAGATKSWSFPRWWAASRRLVDNSHLPTLRNVGHSSGARQGLVSFDNGPKDEEDVEYAEDIMKCVV